MGQVVSFVLKFLPLSHHIPHKVCPSCFVFSPLAHPRQRSSSAEKPVVLKLCFTGRSSSYSDIYVVKEGRKPSNTTENPIATHCCLALNMIIPHSSPAAAAGPGFTALRDCLRSTAPFELIEDDTSVELKKPPFDSRGHIRRTGSLGYLFLRRPCLRGVKTCAYQRRI